MIKELDLYKNGNYYVGLKFEDNKRVAMRLTEEEDVELIPKYPELVDIKLTDVCYIGCSWCYQDSRPDSKHGDLTLIKQVIDSLNLDITEIAFGGGDVLQHPDIKEILRYVRDKGATSNNITMNWQSVMRYGDKLVEVFPYLDAIGVSIVGVGQVPVVVEKLKELGCYIPSRICFHVIPDLYNERILKKIIEEVLEYSKESDILFLGFKDNGRGSTVSVERLSSMDNLFKFMKTKRVNLQCDTKFVKDYLGVIKEYSNELYFDIKEGEYSLNIDCVEGIYTQSSYNLDFKGVIDEGFDIVEAFGRVREYGGLSRFEG